VVIDALRASGAGEVAGVLDDDPGREGSDVLGVPVKGDVAEVTLARFGVERAVIAIGSNPARAAMARRLGPRLAWVKAVHPTAYVSPGVRLGAGSVVFAGAVVQPDTVIGEHAILNTMCSVDHDGAIGDFAHVGPGARLAGNVRIGEGAFLGVGSCVIPGRLVGAWSTVGAGGVVVTDIPGGVTAKGVPARFSGG
jgi:sugar O-acyltransferase (sialic acid O-acetyltransferase NeuD family)